MDQQKLKSLVDYDPLTGQFTWLVTRRRVRRGMRAGHTSARTGGKYAYRVIKFEGVTYLEHRLAFLWMTGEWPEIVDHIDGDPSNNTWGNLRSVTQGQNLMNSRVQERSLSGVKGVRKRGDSWQAKITADKVVYQLGTFDTAEEAAAVVRAKRQELHGEFARHE